MIETIKNKKFLTISTSELMTEFKKYLGQPYVYGGDGTLKECMSSKCTHHKKVKNILAMIVQDICIKFYLSGITIILVEVHLK